MHEGRVKKVQGNTDSVLSLAVNPTLSYYVTMHVQGVPLCLMVDTGAAVSPKERLMQDESIIREYLFYQIAVFFLIFHAFIFFLL